MTISYDADEDIMEVTFSQPCGLIRYAESSTGDILNFCQETNEIVGLTILFYEHRMKRDGKIDIPEVGLAGFSSEMFSLLGKTHNTDESIRRKC